MSSEDKLGGNIVMNLFSILPSNNKIKINFVQRKSSSEINRLIYELEKHGCISGPQYGEYLGLSPGVYFICSDKMPENIDYTTIEIESTSYVIKYILLKSIQKKFENLGISKKVYLPRKWSEYSQITVCDKDVIVKSKRGLFEVRQCLVMRVEHLVIDDENKLFLLADLKIRRFSHLSLDKIINILKQETKYYDNEIEDLLKSHFYRCDTNMGTCACRLIGLQNDSVVVSTPWGREVLSLSSVYLNPHPKFTRDFIEKTLGENLSKIDKIRLLLGRKRPKEKIENTMRLLKKLLLETGVFPIDINSVNYNLEVEPLRIYFTEDEVPV